MVVTYHMDNHRRPQRWPWPRRLACSAVVPVGMGPDIVGSSTRGHLGRRSVAGTRSYWSAMGVRAMLGSGAAESAFVAGWVVER